MKPRFCLLASMLSWVGLSMSKKDRIGGIVSDVLILKKASSWVLVHRKAFLVLRRGCSGANSEAIVSALKDNWLTRPFTYHI